MGISIALSGGGTRGIAHLGVYKALQENGIEVSQISGVSAGAIVGAFMAAGYSPDEVLEILLKTKLFKLLRLSVSQTSLLKLDLIAKLLKTYFPQDSFESLKTPLYVSALSLKTGRIKYFEKGELINPLLASSSVPLLFKPITINQEQFVDGGLAENLPIASLKGQGNFIVGVHSNPINPEYDKLTVRTYLERIMLITINNNAQHSLKEVDFTIEPEALKTIRWSDYSRTKAIFEIGYEYTLSVMYELKEKLKSFEESKLRFY